MTLTNPSKKYYLFVEYLVLFVLTPTILYLYRVQLKRYLLLSLILFALGSFIYLFLDKSFNRKSLYSLEKFTMHIKYILLRFVVGGILLSVTVVFHDGELLFNFPRTNFNIWVMVMIFYPVLSVYPQEILYRSFIQHRYQSIFYNPSLFIIASGVAFGYMHIVFGNWLAPILSGVGGILFSITYVRTKSILFPVLEHGLWGDLIFTIGLGSYFYSGAIT
jgi:membrane protease YdiL (CAAX protease family)